MVFPLFSVFQKVRSADHFFDPATPSSCAFESARSDESPGSSEERHSPLWLCEIPGQHRAPTQQACASPPYVSAAHPSRLLQHGACENPIRGAGHKSPPSSELYCRLLVSST